MKALDGASLGLGKSLVCESGYDGLAGYADMNRPPAPSSACCAALAALAPTLVGPLTASWSRTSVCPEASGHAPRRRQPVRN